MEEYRRAEREHTEVTREQKDETGLSVRAKQRPLSRQEVT